MKTFAQALCEQVGCPRKDYLRVALKHCLYPRARLLSLLPPFHPRAEDIELLEGAGAAATEKELRELLSDYWVKLHHHGGLLAKRCKLRVSGRRLNKLFARVMRAEGAAKATINEGRTPAPLAL